MAEAVILFAGMIIVLGGAVIAAVLVRKSARERKQLPGKITRKRERELRQLDRYIQGLDQAASEEDIQRLEQKREEDR